VGAYPEVIADRDLLEAVLSRLEVYPGRKQLANWRSLADAGEFHELVKQVVERHYDPSYARHARHDQRPKLDAIDMATLDQAWQEAAAAQIMRIMNEA
jgi:tRNA 2-selenouridine synthase